MQFQKQCGDYIILGTLGEGAHSKAKLGLKNGQRVAIKMFKKQHYTPQNIMFFANEVNILKLLIHPNIIKLIDFSDSFPYRKKNGQIEKRICIILELAQGGEFFDYIQNFGTLSEQISRFYFKQLLVSMIFMTNNGICHRDLKLDNLLLDENFNLKVADFGYAKLMEGANLRGFAGTIGYVAPEVIAGIPYNGTKADIFSAGVILCILILGEIPDSKILKNDTLRQKVNEKNNLLIKRQKHEQLISDDLINLLYGMLAPNPDKRFSLDQCMEHPWTNGPVATQQQIYTELKSRYQKMQALKHASLIQKEAEKKKKLGQIGEFRSTIEEIEKEFFQEIIEKHQLNFENRVLRKGQELGFPNEILLYHDPQFIFCYLLKYCQKFNSKVIVIDDKKYKINFQVVDELDETINYTIEILDCDNEMIKLNINKQSGDYLKFKEILNRIKDAIKENCNNYLQEEEVQQK